MRLIYVFGHACQVKLFFLFVMTAYKFGRMVEGLVIPPIFKVFAEEVTRLVCLIFKEIRVAVPIDFASYIYQNRLYNFLFSLRQRVKPYKNMYSIRMGL